jgi:hypothetical protein
MSPSPSKPSYEIRFQYLFIAGRALSFPCDASGNVELNALSERARNNYFYARSCIGREFSMPAILSCSIPVSH